MLYLHKENIVLMYIWMVYPKWYVSFAIYIYENNVFNNNIILLANFYASINVSLLQQIYIFGGSKDIQHYMLANYDYNNMSIDNCKIEILQTFMSEFFLSVTILLTLVYMEVINNIYIISGG